MSDPQTQDEPRMPWGGLAAVTAVVLAADQATKFLAVKHFTNLLQGVEGLGPQLSKWLSEKHLMGMARSPVELEPVLRAFWSWRYAENPGAAFSFAHSWPESVRVPFFHVVTLVAIVMIAGYYRKLKPGQALLQWALSLVMGGATGNLADRVLRGYVIDFIDWHLGDHLWQRPGVHWPTFNVADAAISVGVGLIALDSILAWRAQRKAPAPAAAQPGA